MAARNKPSPFSVASERFARFLRTEPVENTKTVRRDARHACFTTFDSQWQRFLCKTTVAATPWRLP